MATIYLDGSVCLNREGGCFKYYQAITTRFTKWGHTVVISPGPEKVLDALEGPGVSIVRRTVPQAPSWLPNGKWRSSLTKVRKALEAMKVRKAGRAVSAAPSSRPVFFSYYYNPAPDPQMASVCIALDFIDEIFSSEMDSPNNRVLRSLRAAAMEQASRIMCISETTRRDLLARYPHFEAKSQVVGIGVDIDYFRERVSDDNAGALMRVLDLKRPYILHVGGRLHHKNFPLLAEAFAQGGFGSEYDLVCTGDNLIDEEKALFLRLGIEKHVRHIRFPEEPVLRALYQRASLFVYPSRYEGFGIPPLEAMASGCPVIAARGGSIPEVSGPGCWLVSPDDPAEMAHAMRTMLRPAVTAQFRANGLKHVETYRWDPIARQILDTFLAAAGETPAKSVVGRKTA